MSAFALLLLVLIATATTCGALQTPVFSRVPVILQRRKYNDYTSSIIIRKTELASSTGGSSYGGDNISKSLESFFSNLFQQLNGGGSKTLGNKGRNAPAAIYRDVVIIGAGIAGLSCATALDKAGIDDLLLLEGADAVGGRVRTDEVDGFLLDRGFQVFIDSYPQAKSIFDYKKLQLRSFLPGAIVRFDGGFHLVSDPLRRPQDLLPTLLSPIGSLLDKVLVGIFSLTIRADSLDAVLSRPEVSTAKYLSENKGLSSSLIDRFFTPFYQGIYLSPLTLQSSRMFEFVFKMFTEGSATLPTDGMGAIPQQLADALPIDTVRLNSRVTRIKATKDTADGKYELDVEDSVTGKSSKVVCSQLIVATDPPAAKKLLNEFTTKTEEEIDSIEIPAARGSTCLYFAFDGVPPVTDPILILNGENKLEVNEDGSGILYTTTVNNVCFPSQLSESYAPLGKSLASVTIVGADESVTDAALGKEVLAQLVSWWGPSVQLWKLLRVYRIRYAQPAQNPPYAIDGQPLQLAGDDSSALYCIGDHRATATLNGAIASGKKAAKLVAKALSKRTL